MEPLFCCFKNCNTSKIASIAIICNAITLLLIKMESIFSDYFTAVINGFFDLFSIIFVILIIIYLCLGINQCECLGTPRGQLLCLVPIRIYPAKILIFIIGELRISSNPPSDDKEVFFHDTKPKYNYFYFFIRLFYIILSIIVPLCANVLHKRFDDIDSNQKSNSSNPREVGVTSSNEVASH